MVRNKRQRKKLVKREEKRNLYFSDRKEYYRRYRISKSLEKTYRKKRRESKIYFYNFEIAGTRGYVVGSLSTPTRLNLEEAKKIIKNTLPTAYKPVNLYEAVENGIQKVNTLILLREDNEVLNVNV